MHFSLPWGKLPSEARYGQSFDEPVRLFRGDKLQKLTTAKELGIFSTALAAGNMSDIYDFGILAGSQDQWLQAILKMQEHTTMAAQQNGETTPFISASPSREFAERFATTPGDAVVELIVPANRLIAPMLDIKPDYMPNELLIVGGVLPEEVVAVYPVPANVK